MKQENGKAMGPARGGLGLPLLALILSVCTLISLCLFLLPAQRVKRALGKTLSSLQEREEGVLEPLSLLGEGSVALEGEGLRFSRLAKEGATLASFDRGEVEFTVSSQGQEVTLSSSALEENLTETAPSPWVALQESGLLSEEIAQEERTLLPVLFALTDADALELDPVFSLLGKAISVGKGSLSSQKGEYALGSEGISATVYTDTYTARRLENAFKRFAKEGEKPEVQRAVLSKAALLFALGGKEPDRAMEENLSLFLSGKGERFAALQTLASAEGASLTVTYYVRGGAVMALSAKFTSGDTVGEVQLFFGKKVSRDRDLSLSLSWQTGEETLFSASLTHRVTEDSRTAFIREMDFSVSDPHQILGLWESGQKSGKIRYSWGKEKGDLGLRIITPEGQVGFGGVVEKRSGKSTVCRISRFEVDRVNRLTGSLTLTLKKEPEPFSPLPKGVPLVGTPEENEARRALFLEKYKLLTGGEA